jgi:hypothetical protein
MLTLFGAGFTAIFSNPTNISDILNHPIALFFFCILVVFFGLTGIQKKRREKKA